MSDFFKYISFIFASLYIITYGWIILHLINLKHNNCICSIGWKFYVVLIFSILLLLQNIISIMVLFFNIPNFIILFVSIFGLIHLINIANIVIMLLYSHELKKKNCKCAIVNHTQEVMKIFAITQIVIISTAFVLFIIGLSLLTYNKKKNNKK